GGSGPGTGGARKTGAGPVASFSGGPFMECGDFSAACGTCGGEIAALRIYLRRSRLHVDQSSLAPRLLSARPRSGNSRLRRQFAFRSARLSPLRRAVRAAAPHRDSGIPARSCTFTDSVLRVMRSGHGGARMLRTAVIGMRGIGNTHAEVYHSDSLAELVAVCDIVAELADE